MLRCSAWSLIVGCLSACLISSTDESVGAPILPDEVTVTATADAFDRDSFAGGTDDPNSPDPTPNTTTSSLPGANVSEFESIFGSSFVNSSARAADNGVLRARSNVNGFGGEGPPLAITSGSAPVAAAASAADSLLEGNSQSSWQATFTNTTGGPAQFSLDFFVDNASLSSGGGFFGEFSSAVSAAAAAGDYDDYDAYLNAVIKAEILVNGTSVYGFDAHLSADDGAVNPEFEFTAFNPQGISLPEFEEFLSDGDSFVFADAYGDTVNLGTFADGESFTVEYLATALALSEGLGGPFDENSVNAGFGDPLNANVTPPPGFGNFQVNAVAAVPEPMSLASWLLAMPFALLLWRHFRGRK